MRTARSSSRPGGTPRTRHPPVNRMTDRCKNITLPQNSFAGGNKLCMLGGIQKSGGSEILTAIPCRILSFDTFFLVTSLINAQNG